MTRFESAHYGKGEPHHKWVQVRGSVKTTSRHGYLFICAGMPAAVWLPRRIASWDGEHSTMVVLRRTADEKGIPYEQ